MAKLTMTPQRQVILDELKKSHIHPTADDIYERVRQRLPRISLGTVYRNLEILAENGMIRKMALAGTQKRFDGNPKNHYHLRCIRCGRVEDAPVEPLTSVEFNLRGKSDYEILGHHLEFIGLCPRCKDTASNIEQIE